jgi:type I restriction enzyme M protein
VEAIHDVCLLGLSPHTQENSFLTRSRPPNIKELEAMLQNTPELKTKIDQLWNRFWSGGISNPLTAIEQITYLLFIKRLDELDVERQREAERRGETYISKFAGYWSPPDPSREPGVEGALERRTLRWSEFRSLPAKERLGHVQRAVFPFVKDMSDTDSSFARHMQNAVFSIPKASLLVEAMDIIDEIYAIMRRDARGNGQAFQDIQGDVYEMLLSEIASAGKNGQFRTPRHIIKLMTELVQPQLGQRIIDPACGTSGFLLGAYQFIATQLSIRDRSKEVVIDEDGFLRAVDAFSLDIATKSFLQKSLYGYDIDTTMVRLGIMNLIMHGIDDPKIDYQDTLSRSYTEEAEYDIVLANPPFTGSIDKGDLNKKLQLPTTKTELLFVENIYRLLKQNGSACVIVPQGVLTGSGTAFKALRRLLLERCELRAVIGLPSGVFKPYAGVSTAILLFSKVFGPDEQIERPATEKVWFYEATADGYSLDDRRSKQGDNGDLQDIITKYRARNSTVLDDRTGKCFMVSLAEISAEGFDLSPRRYREDKIEMPKYDPPSVILKRLIDIEVGSNDRPGLAKCQQGIIGDLLTLESMI